MLYQHRVQVTWWLVICAALVFSMVILGGAVRVTGSGLSMVDWQPLLGILPPLTEASWNLALDQYLESPEGRLVNQDISMSGFQFIYYMEYLHRLLGRMIGIVFFVPFVFFLVRGGMPSGFKAKLWLLLLLGGLQGLMGWYMVKSGLVDDPHVSQYRLTAHLLLAVIIFLFMARLIVGLWNRSASERLQGRAGWVLGLVVLMIASGGFMAGTRAGHIFNTWPLMGDELVPGMLAALQPWWRNLFENAVTIQFIHRWLAIVVGASVIWLGLRTLRNDSSSCSRRLGALAIVLVLTQIGLGIATLVSGVPQWLAVAHQGTGLLLAGCVVSIWSLGRDPVVSWQD